MTPHRWLLALGWLLAPGWLLALAACATASAQKHDLGLMFGREFVPDRAGIAAASGMTLYANYAQRLIDGKLASVYLEVPFAATPQHRLMSANVSVPRDYASLFITPGVKLKFASPLPIVPYVAAGGGYAQFEQSVTQQDGKPNPGPRRTHAALSISPVAPS